MRQFQQTKKYDLQERTFLFAKHAMSYTKTLTKTAIHIEIARQLIRSSGSVGANAIEAIESLGQKDALLHLRICRKEAKESTYWLKLTEPSPSDSQLKDGLIQESIELTKIFGAIIMKLQSRM